MMILMATYMMRDGRKIWMVAMTRGVSKLHLKRLPPPQLLILLHHLHLIPTFRVPCQAKMEGRCLTSTLESSWQSSCSTKLLAQFHLHPASSSPTIVHIHHCLMLPGSLSTSQTKSQSGLGRGTVLCVAARGGETGKPQHTAATSVVLDFV